MYFSKSCLSVSETIVSSYLIAFKSSKSCNHEVVIDVAMYQLDSDSFSTNKRTEVNELIACKFMQN